MKGQHKTPTHSKEMSKLKMLHVCHNLGLEAPKKALKRILHKKGSTYKCKKAVQVALYCTVQTGQHY